MKNEVNVFDKSQLIGGHLPAIAITIEYLLGSLLLVKETGSGEFCIRVVESRNQKRGWLNAVTCSRVYLLHRFSRWNARDQ